MCTFFEVSLTAWEKKFAVAVTEHQIVAVCFFPFIANVNIEQRTSNKDKQAHEKRIRHFQLLFRLNNSLQ